MRFCQFEILTTVDYFLVVRKVFVVVKILMKACNLRFTVYFVLVYAWFCWSVVFIFSLRPLSTLMFVTMTAVSVSWDPICKYPPLNVCPLLLNALVLTELKEKSRLLFGSFTPRSRLTYWSKWFYSAMQSIICSYMSMSRMSLGISDAWRKIGVSKIT